MLSKQTNDVEAVDVDKIMTMLLVVLLLLLTMLRIWLEKKKITTNTKHKVGSLNKFQVCGDDEQVATKDLGSARIYMSATWR